MTRCFFADPPFVQHLDGLFRARLTALYRERIPAGSVVVDLMSNWVSHLPEAWSPLIVAGWQYLRQPEEVAAELLRVLRPGCQLIVAFSNRMFTQKAPRIWIDGGDRDHLAVVARVLVWPTGGRCRS